MSSQAITIQARPTFFASAKRAFQIMAGIALSAAITAEQAIAQVGGGTGTGAAVQARVTGVASTFQVIMYSIGAFVLTAAFMGVGYAMGFGGKKWSDVANVCYGCLIAGAAPIFVGWLFS